MIALRRTLIVSAFGPMGALALALFMLPGCGGGERSHDEAADETYEAPGGHDGGAANEDANEAPRGSGHAEDEDEHGEGEAPYVEPVSYSEGIHEIHERLERIEALIEGDRLDDVHAEAAVIRDVAGSLARLALQEDSGVPREAVKEINLTARNLAARFGPIDEAGDSGNAAETRKLYDEMVELLKTLEAYATGGGYGGGDTDH